MVTGFAIRRRRTRAEAAPQRGHATSGRSADRLALGRVLGTSARKPPLSDTLLWAISSLAHPFKIEVILSKRVDVLAKQRGREAQNIVVDHLAFGAEPAAYRPEVQRIPSNDSPLGAPFSMGLQVRSYWTGRPPSWSWPLLTLGNSPHSGA